jgi:hypothetical protein
MVGYLNSLAQAVSVSFDAAFLRGLSEMGYCEGQKVRGWQIREVAVRLDE